MQNLIITGKLPSTKDECASLAALNLRIYELNYIRLMEEEEERRQMKLKAVAAKKSKDTTCSFRGATTTMGRGGEEAETATRMDVSHDELSNNNNFNRSSQAIQEEDETGAVKDENSAAAAAATAATTGDITLATTTTTTKTTTIEVFKKRASSAKAVSKDGASAVLAQPRDSLVSTQSDNLIMPVIVSNGCESMLIYLRSCSCLSSYGSARIISLGQLVSPNYQRSNDILKLIKVLFLIRFYYEN